MTKLMRKVAPIPPSFIPMVLLIAASELSALEPPVYSHETHVAAEPFRLTLTTEEAGAEIHYTTNGSAPTPSSLRYRTALRITQTTAVRAIVVRDGEQSPEVAHTFVVSDGRETDFESPLPVVVIVAAQVSPDPETTVPVETIELRAPDGERTKLTETPGLRRRALLALASATAPGRKGGYRVEHVDDSGESTSVEFLGLPAGSNWRLHGSTVFDRAQLRSAVLFDVAREVGLIAPRTRHCEVYVTPYGQLLKAADYAGLYTLMEMPAIGEHRVPITRVSRDDIAEPEITGGYLFRFDQSRAGEDGLQIGEQTLLFGDPIEDEIVPHQLAWVRAHFRAFDAALMSDSYTDPETGYPSYIDVPSWIDYHLLNTFAKNVVAFRVGAYFHKDRGQKIVMGPLWELDQSLDSTDGRDDDPASWSDEGATDYFGAPWWSRLFEDPAFAAEYARRWHELRAGSLSTAAFAARVDALADSIREAQARDSARWQTTPPPEWEEDVERIKEWSSLRASWIDSQLDRPTGSILPGDLHADGTVNLADAIGLLGVLFQGFDFLPCADDSGNKPLLDANGDDGVNIADAIWVLTYLFASGSPPVLGEICVDLPGCPDACVQ